METHAPKAVFLSYAREDTAAAQRIAEALRSHGVEVWFDQSELRGGEAWDQKIRRQINECALFLPIISQHTQVRSKGYFRLEWKLAVEQTHLMAEGLPFLAPVVVDATSDASAVVPLEFLRVQWTRLPGALPTTQFVEQVKRLLEAPVAPKMEAGRPRPATRGEGTAPPAKPRWPGWTWAALAVVVVSVVVFFATRKSAPSPVAVDPKLQLQNPKLMDLAAAKSPALDPHRIAVLPLDNFSPDANDAYLAGGMTEELTSSLAKISGLEVIARTSSDRLKKSGKSLSEIGAELRAGTLLEGSVRKAGEQLRISVQLIDVASQRHLWAQDYNTEFKDIFKMQSDVAARVAEALKVKLLGSEVQRLKKEPTANLEAYRLYVLGRYLWNRRTGADHKKAIDYFNQALAQDPLYAEAQAGLGLCFATNYIRLPNKEAMAKAQTAAAKALEIDPTLGEAHAALACAKDYLYDWTGAEKEHRLAIQLSPNSATAHQWFAEHFRFLGRFDEALAEMRRAQELDPFSLIIKSSAGYLLLCKGQIDDAIQECRNGLELDPGFAQLHQDLGDILLKKRLFPDAVAEFQKVRALNPAGPHGLAGFGCALASSGDRGHALQALNELEDWRKKGFEVQYEIAWVYLGLGDTEKVLESLERALGAGEFIAYINTDPNWEELRPNPRFQALLRKMGLGK